jgi:alpha-methylacyl-CoA racemase
MGPLDGIRILEIAGIGPGPFAAMVLADQGAEVLRLERPGGGGLGNTGVASLNLLNRGRRNAAVDLKHPKGVDLVLRLCERSDGLLEGFRPGVMERLGLGPDPCMARNPRLVYGRMTGWGQEGPMAQAAGHDLNYLALSGTLSAIGRAGEAPVPPLNLVGDFGGGGMLLAFGMLAALLERERSGKGQVVDAAMLDGASLLTASIHGASQAGFWGERGTNLLDGGAHFYDSYQTSDGEYVSIGSIEPQFYAGLLRCLGLENEDLPHQLDRGAWPSLKERIRDIIKTRTRGEWCEIFGKEDICFAPVLGLEDAADHPHNKARNTFVDVDGVRNPAPAPRFSRTPGAISRPPATTGEHTDEALADWGISESEIAALRDADAIA